MLTEELVDAALFQKTSPNRVPFRLPLRDVHGLWVQRCRDLGVRDDEWPRTRLTLARSPSINTCGDGCGKSPRARSSCGKGKIRQRNSAGALCRALSTPPCAARLNGSFLTVTALTRCSCCSSTTAVSLNFSASGSWWSRTLAARRSWPTACVSAPSSRPMTSCCA